MPRTHQATLDHLEALSYDFSIARLKWSVQELFLLAICHFRLTASVGSPDGCQPGPWLWVYWSRNPIFDLVMDGKLVSGLASTEDGTVVPQCLFELGRSTTGSCCILDLAAVLLP